MAKYTGIRCLVCNKKFLDNDDIVVCPICGAPHHRDCYAESGACAYAANHIGGAEWRPPSETPPPESVETPVEAPEKPSARDGIRYCASCSSSNPANSTTCQTCGAPINKDGPVYPAESQQNSIFPGFQLTGLSGAEAEAFKYGGLEPDDTIEEIPVEDVRQFVGDSAAYYLPRFKIMSEHKFAFAPNFSAFFFSFFYFFYRKMYAIGAVLLAIFIASMIPNMLAFYESFPALMHQYGFGSAVETNDALLRYYASIINVTNIATFIISVAVSLCANRLYYIKALDSIEKTKTEMGEKPDPALYVQTLSAQGGTNRKLILIIGGTLIGLYFLTGVVLTAMYLSNVPL